MILERSMNDSFLSNTYLVAEPGGGVGFFVDAGGPVEPLLAKAEELDVDVTHVLLTHHHWDHVEELPKILAAFPGAQVLIHPLELKALNQAVPDLAKLVTGEMLPGEDVTVGSLAVTPLHTPGHTAGMLSLLVEGNVFTGDTLFKNSVGGVRAPGSTSYADLKNSVMEVLLKLPPETTLRPGHTDPSTVAAELEGNAFARVWQGLDPEGTGDCTALGDPATLVLLGDDYDGGHKAWIRWSDGRDDIVPGSKVEVA
ncbi:MAG: MBL fold metallo-hydrolase [Solirubrobacterales bacterium]|nr:MBL fold metallo-hydrolase [Solirubrobacterales bacterium]